MAHPLSGEAAEGIEDRPLRRDRLPPRRGQVERESLVRPPRPTCPPIIDPFPSEAAEAVRDGAAEVDMVINLGALKAGDFATVYNDIAAVVKAAAPADVKVILETVFLSDAQKVAGAYIAAEAGAAWVKTCTGFAGGGASAADVRLMWKTVRDRGVQVKASAGIRTFEKCKEMFDAGAGRIGT